MFAKKTEIKQRLGAYIRVKPHNSDVVMAALLDTGCNLEYALINKQIIDELQLPMESVSMSLGTAGASNLIVCGELKEFTFEMDGLAGIFKMPCLIAEGLSHAFNLGMGFIQKYQVSFTPMSSVIKIKVPKHGIGYLYPQNIIWKIRSSDWRFRSPKGCVANSLFKRIPVGNVPGLCTESYGRKFEFESQRRDMYMKDRVYLPPNSIDRKSVV